MTFIITLIALVIERFFHWSHLRYWRWFGTYQQWLSHSRIARLPAGVLLALCLLPLVLLTGLLNYFLAGWFYGSLKLIFGVVVLLYCLGPANIWVQAWCSINQLQKDEDPNLIASTAQTEFAFHSAGNAQQFHQAFVRAIFIAANERVFSVVFWFILLGPVGAVLYRSIALMAAGSPLGLTQMARTVQQWLDWLPVRLLTFIFALGGHFVRVFACWKRMVLTGPEMNDVLLTDCGLAALDVMENGMMPEAGSAERETIVLLDRVFVMALVALALIVLIL